MNILIADKFPETAVEALRRLGHDVDLAPDLGANDLPAAVGGYDVLVVRSTRVTAATIEAADRLSLVIRAGAGYNTIDWRAAAAEGVYVANCPGKNAVAVAELTMGLVVAVDRRIPDAVADLRAGRWRKKEYGRADGIAGRTMAIIGLGDIGAAVARRAHAFELRIAVEDKPGRAPAALALIEELGITVFPDRNALLAAADMVTIHVPGGDATRHLVSADFLAAMKPGAVLINTSRGDVIDEEALLAAITAKGIRCGLDVYADEPPAGEAPFDSALARHPSVYGTHHIGASTNQAQEAIAAEVVAIVEDFAAGSVRNVVNLENHLPGTVTLAIRHKNRIGVLAAVLGVIRGAGLNVEEMHNRVFAGEEAAIATIQVRGDLAAPTVDAIAEVDNVIGVSVSPRPR